MPVSSEYLVSDGRELLFPKVKKRSGDDQSSIMNILLFVLSLA